jgi:hypothetical protein
MPEFDIGSGDELKERYGWTWENWQPIDFRSEIVPQNLQDLIPAARKWGITCDVTRHDVAERVSKSELEELARALEGRHEEIEDWLYSFQDQEYPDEAAAFEAMVVMEMEECDGPGLRGFLDWALVKYRQSPSEENRARLQRAYEELVEVVGPAGRVFSEALAEARRLLGIPEDEEA